MAHPNTVADSQNMAMTEENWFLPKNGVAKSIIWNCSVLRCWIPNKSSLQSKKKKIHNKFIPAPEAEVRSGLVLVQLN